MFPIKNFLWFLLGTSAIIQCAIMSYRHLTGIYLIKDSVTFFAAIILNSLISVLAGIILSILDLYIIRKLNKQLKWGDKTIIRICVQLIFTIIIAVAVSVLLTCLIERIVGFKEPLVDVLIRNGLIFSVVNILLTAILEGWIFYRESRRNIEQAKTLSHELFEMRFEVLKNQIDPHFMFNNLNVLSALIDNNPSKAQQFIEDFSDLYRYILDTIEKPVVSIAQELQFIKSYICLQQIRHNEAITLTNKIPVGVYEANILPFSLQIVIENAIKHNFADANNPLKIELGYANEYIVIKNNIQPLVSSKSSTGIGQENLIKRYEMISDLPPVFEENEGVYVVKLPLIKE